MKKIEMGKKYRRGDQSGAVRYVDGKNRRFPVLWEDDFGGVYSFDECGKSASLGPPLIEISPYADIPIDTPGWARYAGLRWVPRYFAGIDVNGKPVAWADGATSFSSINGAKLTWDEFTTTKPEVVE